MLHPPPAPLPSEGLTQEGGAPLRRQITRLDQKLGNPSHTYWKCEPWPLNPISPHIQETPMHCESYPCNPRGWVWVCVLGVEGLHQRHSDGGQGRNEIVRPEGVLTCLVWQSHLQMHPSQKPRLLSQSERAEPDGARTRETSGVLAEPP